MRSSVSSTLDIRHSHFRRSTLDPRPFFQDVSALLSHTHQEAFFNDLDRQPLLPKMLSRLGPGVAWFDLDSDGHDELIIGTGRGGSPAVFRGDGKGGFTRWQGTPWNTPAPDDLTAVVGWTPAPGQRSLLVGVAKYEVTEVSPGPVLRFDASSANPQSAIRNPQSDSPGPLAVADIDGDGDLDLFVGGRVIAGRYPEPASSFIYRNDGGQLVLDDSNSAVLAKVGLVSGAVFSDLDGDGFPELVLACEWGPVRVFQNSAGKFREVTADLGLAGFSGWWNSVTTGDFDGDGRLDIVAGNWGLNSSYHQPTLERPVRLYYGDFDEDGRIDLVVTENSGATKLFRNERARPGLRVRLAGSPGNPDGMGAVERLVFGQKQGPAREVHGGSGYWSQDSAVQVMATPFAATGVWVRWPGGRTTTSEIPAGAKEVAIDPQGRTRVLR